MARPLPVNMLLAGTGAVLLVSGLGGKSIGDVLKGSFGQLEVKNPNIGSQSTGAGAVTTATGGGLFEPSPVSFSTATVAPPPPSIGRHGAVPPPNEALYWERKRELERYLKRPLTSKENSELRDLERKGEL
jgi:hypothetical protein